MVALVVEEAAASRALGLRPSEVAPLVRQVAAMQQSLDDPADRTLIGCWISPGWGPPATPNSIRFGRAGQPWYFAGPNDNPHAVLATLDRTVGAGNYQFLAPIS